MDGPFMKVLIVDDEPLARSRLQRLLASNSDYDVVGQAENGEQAIEQFNQHSPDVVLMDIRMPLMDGLQAARHLATSDTPPAVIFCTAYNDYALEAFEANAVDYLLKPVNKDKLAQALTKTKTLNRVQLSALAQNQQQNNVGNNSRGRSHLSVHTGRGIELITINTVRYFLADQKYISVYYYHDGQLKEVLIDEPLKDLEQELGARFIRIHRNALAAVDHIEGIEKTQDGARLKLAHVLEGPMVSRRHLSQLKQLLQHL